MAPIHNEGENLEAFLDEVSAAFRHRPLPFELIAVDDGSTDDSLALLVHRRSLYPWLRVVRMTRRPATGVDGKGPAYLAGFSHARGDLVATIDADLQNPVADLVLMVELLRREGVDMIQGDRTAGRRDNPVRRLSSRIGRGFRRTLLGDTIRDTACGLRVLRREVAMALPLQYRGVHRFTGYYAKLLGYRVLEVPTSHRQRTAGTSKYGIWNRALPGLWDLLALRWMGRTLLPTDCEEVTAPDSESSP